MRSNQVTRGSLLILKTGLLISFWPANYSCSASAPSRMVRNLSMENSRAFLPSRGWWNNTGPRDVIFSASAMNKIMGINPSANIVAKM